MTTRRERVIVEAVDQFTTPVAKMAAAATLLDRSLDRVDGSSVGARDGVADLNDEVDKSSPVFTQAARDIDRYSGRLRLLSEAALVLGPALVPIGAAAIPAIAGLTAGLGAAAGAVGTAVLAFDGMGDALESISDYRLEPTTENLDKMRLALAEVGPAGAEFAQFLSGLAPALDELQNTARAGLFPGLQEGIENLLPLLPQVERIVGNIATALGDLAADAGEALASERFEAFFNYIETDAGPTLDDFGRATGNVVEGLSHLMVAFAPLSRDFSGGLEEMTRSFADWAEGLSETEGFQEFVAYVRRSGPQVIQLLGSIGNAFVGIAQAAAPFGSAVVPALTALADVFSAIARSPIGPPLFTAAAGFMAISRASTIAAAGVARFNAASASGVGGAGFATKIAGVAAAFGILGNEFAKLNGSKVDFSELEGNLNSIAKGGGAETIDHIVSSIKTLQQSGPDAYEIPSLGGLFGNTPRDNALEYIEAVDTQLAQLVASGNAEKAAKIFNEVMASLTDMPQGTSFSPFGQSAKDFDAYAKALDEVGPAATRAAKGVERAAVQAERSRAEMIAARAAARGTAQGFISLGDSLDDSKTSLSGWIRQLQQQADALRDFTKNARTAAERGLNQGLIKSLNEAGPAGAMRMRQLANATDSEIKRANTAWRQGQQAIREYVNMQVPPKKLRADNSQALGAINQVRTELQALRDRTVVVNMVYKRSAFDVATKADGGTVPSTGLPYADRHPYLLADGEEVISNRYGQADRHRSLLKAINANRLADGGTAGAPGLMFGGTAGVGTAISLSADAASRSLAALADLGVKELRTREKLLQNEVDRDKRREDALRSQIESLQSAVADRFQSDLFGSASSSDLAESGLSAAAIAQMTSVNALNVLRGDIADARAMRRALREARESGIRGSALSYLAQNADAGQIAALSGNDRLARQFNRLYGERREVSARTGQFASQVTGLDRRLERVIESRKEDTKLLGDVNRRLEQIEKNTKDGYERAGRGAAETVQGEMVKGHQRRGGY